MLSAVETVVVVAGMATSTTFVLSAREWALSLSPSLQKNALFALAAAADYVKMAMCTIAARCAKVQDGRMCMKMKM